MPASQTLFLYFFSSLLSIATTQSNSLYTSASWTPTNNRLPWERRLPGSSATEHWQSVSSPSDADVRPKNGPPRTLSVAVGTDALRSRSPVVSPWWSSGQHWPTVQRPAVTAADVQRRSVFLTRNDRGMAGVRGHRMRSARRRWPLRNEVSKLVDSNWNDEGPEVKPFQMRLRSPV